MSRGRPHRTHARPEPMPFDHHTVWVALWVLTHHSTGGIPVTASEVAEHVRQSRPRTNTKVPVTHNDLVAVRARLLELVAAGNAEECAERPNYTGRRARMFIALTEPPAVDPLT
jgi:hypothetical protein